MVVVQYITIILLSCLVLCVVRESKNEPQKKHENNLNKVGKKKKNNRPGKLKSLRNY